MSNLLQPAQIERGNTLMMQCALDFYCDMHGDSFLNKKASLLRAGFAPDYVRKLQYSKEINRKFQAAAAQQIQYAAGIGISTLVELAQSSEDEKVQLGAAKALSALAPKQIADDAQSLPDDLEELSIAELEKIVSETSAEASALIAEIPDAEFSELQ